MPNRPPIRIIVPKLDMSRHDPSLHNSPPQSLAPSRRTHRTHETSRAERRHRHERSQSQVANPMPAVHDPPSLDAADTPPVTSPPFRAAPSPGAEPELLPGGGVQIPQGFRFSQPDYGHYRRRDSQDGYAENTRVLGRMGLGVFKGLRKIPAAIVKAGRSYGPRNQENRDMSPVPETDHEAEPRPGERPGRMLRESPIQDDVETYLEPEEEEAHAREEQLLYDYIQRKRMSRDRAFRKRTRQQTARSARSVPAPPSENVPSVLVPGAHTPAASVAPSHVDHSQVGHSDAPQPAPDVRLEAEQMRREREELEQAQQRERARKIYAAEAVRQQLSSVSSDQPDVIPTSRHHRSASEPRPPRLHNHVFSGWSAERDMAGRRQENRPDEDLTNTSLIFRILRFMQQIRDLPWVADRVAADYIPGGVKPKPSSSRYYTTSPRSDGTFTSQHVQSTVSDSPIPVHARRPASPSGSKPSGQSWYTQENILVLPVGVDPPPGFIPYPYPIPGVTAQAEVEGALSASSHTHVETPPAVPGSSTSGPGYLDGESYQFVPAEGSKAGRPYTFVPMSDGRHQPMVVPGRGKQPGYVYSHLGPPSFVPVAR